MLRVLRRGGLLAAGFGALAATAVGVGGCHREGPWPGASLDEFTYISRPWEPKTITVVDTRTNESVWSVDIPVGQELVVGFSKGTGPNEYTPDEIVWGLMPAGQQFGQRHNRMPCPPSSARRLDMAIRAVPEPVWSDVPGSSNYRPEPRPIQSVGGRVVEPVERRPTKPPATTNQAPLPAPSPSDQPPNPTEPPPAAEPSSAPPPAPPAPTDQPKKADEPATSGNSDVKEVPPSSEKPKPAEPPIDIPD
jgi:hypothetical protein